MTHFENVSAPQLKQWLESDEAVLFDVREPAEHQSEAILAAVNLPLGQITPTHFDPHITAGKKLVFHCQSGLRAQRACEALAHQGKLAQVFIFAGGIKAWKRAGLPIQKTGRRVLALDRQVQLGIGLIIITGTVLGLTISKLWFALPVFAGLGLINAGLTGWCGLAKVIAKMPWNRV